MLYDSSVHEPTRLLHALIRQGSAEDLQERCASTYTGRGNPRLIEAIARTYGLNPDSLLTGTGCTAALWLVYQALLSPGDHVLVESPGFQSFVVFATERGVRVERTYRSGTTFGLDSESIAAQLQPRTRLLVISNCNNPTSAAVTADTLLEIAAIARERNILVLVDEVYGDFLPDSVRPRPAAALDPCFISVSSLTKVYGLSSLKCGWVVCDPAVMERLLRVHTTYGMNGSRLGHGVASLVLDRRDAFTAHWRDTLRCNRELLVEASNEWVRQGLLQGEVPEYGCMYFPRVVGVSDTRHLAHWLWQHSRVVVAPGEYFGAPGHIRIGFGQPDSVLVAGLRRLQEGLERYRAQAQSGSTVSE